MPTPFPGMAPYLEAPEIWPDLHHELISVIRERLNARLRPRYHSMVEERVDISDEQDPGRRAIVHDVAIQVASDGARYRTSDAAVAEPVVATTMIEEEMREARIVIVDGVGRQVVTVIEVLSPTNKIVGSRGRANYEAKRLEVMQSPVHLVEIDLLRDGEPIYTGEWLPPHDYLVHVCEGGQRPEGILWPILVSQRLPIIKIPLLPADDDVELDLGDVLSTAYDRAGYDLIVDYVKPPRVPFIPPADRWVADWLAKHERK